MMGIRHFLYWGEPDSGRLDQFIQEFGRGGGEERSLGGRGREESVSNIYFIFASSYRQWWNKNVLSHLLYQFNWQLLEMETRWWGFALLFMQSNSWKRFVLRT